MIAKAKEIRSYLDKTLSHVAEKFPLGFVGWHCVVRVFVPHDVEHCFQVVVEPNVALVKLLL